VPEADVQILKFNGGLRPKAVVYDQILVGRLRRLRDSQLLSPSRSRHIFNSPSRFICVIKNVGSL
jgi:hypothetical protein